MGFYLIDNNVIANYISESFPEKAMIFLADVIDAIPNISVITKANFNRIPNLKILNPFNL